MLTPLTLIDARMPATVERWLDAWQTVAPHESLTLLAPNLEVGYNWRGQWFHQHPSDSLTYSVHQDRAALVAYVVAWARAS